MLAAFASQSGDNFNVVLSRCWPSNKTVLAEFLVSAGVLASATCVPDAGVIIYKYHTLASPSKVWGLHRGGGGATHR